MSFQYSVSLTDYASLGSTIDAELITDMNAALSDWSKYITGLGTIVVQLNIDSTSVGRADGGPTAVYRVGSANGVTIEESAADYELATGQHVAGSTADIVVNVDTAYLSKYLYLNPNPGAPGTIPNNKVDAISVFRHEIDHGLGMSGYLSTTGSTSGALAGTYESTYDTHVQATPGGAAYFTGSTAEAVYGGPVPLTSNSTTENVYHVANVASDPLYNDLMNGQYFFYGHDYQISNVDLAILKDTGVPVTSGVGGPLSCFVAGTRVLTPHGEVAIERIRAGDRVVTLSGRLAPVLWVGHRRVSTSEQKRARKLRPIRVEVDAIAPGVPHRPLSLSRDHALLFDDVLISVGCLLNGTTVREAGDGAVHYVHLELDRHDVVVAEGAAAESYVETGARSGFADIAAPVAIVRALTGSRPAMGCRNRHSAGAIVIAVRQRLADRNPRPSRRSA